jgi:hypothetical protein
MTQAAGPGLNEGRSAAALTRQARQVHQAVLAVFAETGRPPARDHLTRMARDHGADPGTVLSKLALCLSIGHVAVRVGGKRPF